MKAIETTECLNAQVFRGANGRILFTQQISHGVTYGLSPVCQKREIVFIRPELIRHPLDVICLQRDNLGLQIINIYQPLDVIRHQLNLIRFQISDFIYRITNITIRINHVICRISDIPIRIRRIFSVLNRKTIIEPQITR